MRKKHAPDQYAPKPKTVTVKPVAAPTEHPALDAAKQLVNWLDSGGVPPSIILLHGLHFARNPKNDGLPVDTLRPHLVMQGTDSKDISGVMDALAIPRADKTGVIAAWLKSNWVKKSSFKPQVPSSQKTHQQPAPKNKPAKPSRKAASRPPTKQVAVVKKKS